jgi:hypothetical protein
MKLFLDSGHTEVGRELAVGGEMEGRKEKETKGARVKCSKVGKLEQKGRETIKGAPSNRWKMGAGC